MAELDTSGGGKKGKKVRSKKQSTRVDLTAMVDLAFLLITFFMLTTTLAKPQAMDLSMPDKDKKNPEAQKEVADNRSMTILLGENNKIEWYMGQIAKPIAGPTTASFGRDIRDVIRQKVKEVPEKVTGDPTKGLIVLIKPSDKSNYKNLVDILDEMKICKVPLYAIGDISPLDIALMKRDGNYSGK